MHTVLRIFIGIILVCLSGCAPVSYPFFSDEEPNLPPVPKYDIDSLAVTCLIQEFTVQLKHDKYLDLGHAKTLYDDGIETIQLDFTTQNIMGMCEARELIVDVVEGLLSRINADSVVGFELANYPFTPANLEIYITFESYFPRYVDPYYMQWVCLEDGLVTYLAADVQDLDKSCWHERHESYETSREIVICQRKGEKKYAENHKPLMDIFGSQRYYPPE